ncbi:MAG: hypothetical protein HYV63_16250 [Candidatus Schekmanbacteria bacterium]|nr:hypothetical protein [Candidatus Schekmanbacteria bacterium]
MIVRRTDDAATFRPDPATVTTGRGERPKSAADASAAPRADRPHSADSFESGAPCDRLGLRHSVVGDGAAPASADATPDPGPVPALSPAALLSPLAFGSADALAAHSALMGADMATFAGFVGRIGRLNGGEILSEFVERIGGDSGRLAAFARRFAAEVPAGDRGRILSRLSLQAREQLGAHLPAGSQGPPTAAMEAPAAAAAAAAAPLDAAGAADAARQSVSLEDVRAREAQVGRSLSVGELARTYPNARLQGRGETLAEIARTPLNKQGPDGAELTLAAATIDRNGDLDVSHLFREELRAHNQNLLIEKGDELPVPLEHSIRNADFVIRDAEQRERLQQAGFRARDGAVRIDMSDMAQVDKALRATGVDPKDAAQVAADLRSQGVATPMSGDDQLRRALLGRLDSPRNEIDIDDRLVDHVGDHNAGITPTVYASAKVSPEHLDEVILAYKRYNNQSYAGQGSWVTQLLGKDEASQHEFDSEATFVKIGMRDHEVESVLAARHYFGELYEQDDLAALRDRTGRDDLTTSVSYKAHGSRLAENEEVDAWAGHGADGVKWYDPRDHILKDKFRGYGDVARGDAVLIPSEDVNLVMECDDRQTLNLQTQFGETRQGILGTGLMDIYNDGGPADRFGGTGWYYEQERLCKEGNGVDQALAEVAGTLDDAIRAAEGLVDVNGDGRLGWGDARAVAKGATEAVERVAVEVAEGVEAAAVATVGAVGDAAATVAEFVKKLRFW